MQSNCQLFSRKLPRYKIIEQAGAAMGSQIASQTLFWKTKIRTILLRRRYIIYKYLLLIIGHNLMKPNILIFLTNSISNSKWLRLKKPKTNPTKHKLVLICSIIQKVIYAFTASKSFLIRKTEPNQTIPNQNKQSKLVFFCNFTKHPISIYCEYQPPKVMQKIDVNPQKNSICGSLWVGRLGMGGVK